MPPDAAAVPHEPRDQFLRLHQVTAMTGCQKTTIYALIKRGSFPRGIPITPRLVAWSETAVQQWMREQKAAAAAEARHA